MNEQLAAIRARRAAVTPGVWEVGSMYTTGDAVVGITDNRIVCVLGAEEQCHADAAFIAAAPADIDTLLAHVAALTAERDERSLVAEQLSMALHIRDTQFAAVTAERDALAQQLQQAQAQLDAVPVSAMVLYYRDAVATTDMARSVENILDAWVRSVTPKVEV